MANPIDAVSVSTNKLLYCSIGTIYVIRQDKARLYPVRINNASRIERAYRMQRRMIDPRSPLEVAMDQHDSDTRETIESNRPY